MQEKRNSLNNNPTNQLAFKVKWIARSKDKNLMRNKDLLSMLDLGAGGIDGIIQMADKIKKGETPQVLAGRTIALLFEKPSLRTRVSFEVGIKQMGLSLIHISEPHETLRYLVCRIML